MTEATTQRASSELGAKTVDAKEDFTTGEFDRNEVYMSEFDTKAETRRFSGSAKDGEFGNTDAKQLGGVTSEGSATANAGASGDLTGALQHAGEHIPITGGLDEQPSSGAYEVLERNSAMGAAAHSQSGGQQQMYQQNSAQYQQSYASHVYPSSATSGAVFSGTYGSTVRGAAHRASIGGLPTSSASALAHHQHGQTHYHGQVTSHAVSTGGASMGAMSLGGGASLGAPSLSAASVGYGTGMATNMGSSVVGASHYASLNNAYNSLSTGHRFKTGSDMRTPSLYPSGAPYISNISTSSRVDLSQQRIISERIIEHEVSIPKRITREDVIEKLVVIPERVVHEEVVEDVQRIREKIVEVAVPVIQEKIVEVPEYEYVDKIVEVPEIIYQEKIREVPKYEYQERIIEIPRTVIQEKLVEVPEIEYREVPVEKIVEVPEIREQIVYKEVPIPQYREVPVPQHVEVVENVDVTRNVPVPVHALTYAEFKLPMIRTRTTKIDVPVCVPRFLEVAVAAETMDAYAASQCEAYAQQIAVLASQSGIGLCDLENLANAIRHNIDVDQIVAQQGALSEQLADLFAAGKMPVVQSSLSHLQMSSSAYHSATEGPKLVTQTGQIYVPQSNVVSSASSTAQHSTVAGGMMSAANHTTSSSHAAAQHHQAALVAAANQAILSAAHAPAQSHLGAAHQQTSGGHTVSHLQQAHHQQSSSAVLAANAAASSGMPTFSPMHPSLSAGLVSGSSGHIGGTNVGGLHTVHAASSHYQSSSAKRSTLGGLGAQHSRVAQRALHVGPAL